VTLSPAALTASDEASDAQASPQLLEHDRYYSAFDAEHVYRVALAPNANADRLDPLDLSRVVWHFDPEFVRAEPYPQLPAAVLITTLKPGLTTLRVSGTTESGQSVRDSAELEITAADPALWRLGDAAYTDAAAIRPQPALPDSCSDVSNLPNNKDIGAAGCPSCHNPAASINVPLTNQLQAFSDATLTQLYADGVQPEGYEHVASFMRNGDEHTNRCIFRKLHAWQMSSELQQALLFKIRSQLPYEGEYDP
jgi:hypothetical protein